MLIPVWACRVAYSACFQQIVDRSVFRSSRGARDSGNVQPPPLDSTSARNAINRYAPRAIGLMEIEHIIRCASPTVGVNPSVMQGEACRTGYNGAIAQSPWGDGKGHKACSGCSFRANSFTADSTSVHLGIATEQPRLLLHK